MSNVKIIEKLKRLNYTINGNPRWLVTFTDGTVLRTKPDSNIAGLIDNSEYRDVPLIVETNGRNQITDLKQDAPNREGSEDESWYIDREFRKLQRSELYRIKVTSDVGDGETRWLNATHDQMIAIRNILAGR